MRVAVFCSDPKHPVWPSLAGYCAAHDYHLTNLASRLVGGDYLFLISCTQFVGKEIRARYGKVFVLHESDLPKGRGWSPVAHQILEGKEWITVSLIEADEEIDAGDVWAQEACYIPRNALAGEIMERVFEAKKALIARALASDVSPRKQAGGATYYPKRTPEDCRLDVNKTIAEQFDLIRICEPRYPAYFEHLGRRYTLEVKSERL